MFRGSVEGMLLCTWRLTQCLTKDHVYPEREEETDRDVPEMKGREGAGLNPCGNGSVLQDVCALVSDPYAAVPPSARLSQAGD